jgi:hypothetical protein
MFAMILSPARKRKTPCTQRVHKFYDDVGGRKICRIDTGFVYEYRFLVGEAISISFFTDYVYAADFGLSRFLNFRLLERLRH